MPVPPTALLLQGGPCVDYSGSAVAQVRSPPSQAAKSQPSQPVARPLGCRWAQLGCECRPASSGPPSMHRRAFGPHTLPRPAAPVRLQPPHPPPPTDFTPTTPPPQPHHPPLQAAPQLGNGTAMFDNQFDYARYSQLRSALGAKAYFAR